VKLRGLCLEEEGEGLQEEWEDRREGGREMTGQRQKKQLCFFHFLVSNKGEKRASFVSLCLVCCCSLSALD
jgi:hypothetical protein